jgi:hypothetical protein
MSGDSQLSSRSHMYKRSLHLHATEAVVRYPQISALTHNGAQVIPYKRNSLCKSCICFAELLSFKPKLAYPLTPKIRRHSTTCTTSMGLGQIPSTVSFIYVLKRNFCKGSVVKGLGACCLFPHQRSRVSLKKCMDRGN